MRVFVVYESMFGNTEAIARAVAEGLSDRMDVELHGVAQATIGDPVDLIVAGGPTHAFSLSRPSTRADAAAQGAQGNAGVGLREWLAVLPGATHGEAFAAFDTRVDKVRHLPGSAAVKASRIAHRHGYAPAGQESFYVTGTSGPLVDGEVERARAWGVELGAWTSEQAAGKARG